jgi:hypothetical protein
LNVSLFNIDSKKIPSLPLLKIEKYYKEKFDANIVWDNKDNIESADKVFVSCVFTKNKGECKFFEEFSDNNPDIEVEIGGSGYDLDKVLPSEIEDIDLHINIGFTSRGCCRNCQFCIVPKKEGRFHPVGDIYDIWDGKSDSIIIMDNNIFADFNHFEKIANQVIKEDIKVDFNQGLDIRILNDDHARLLKKMKPISVWRFAFDSLKYKEQFIRGAEILKDHRLKSKSQIYFLAGFQDGLDKDIERLKIINRYKLNTFFMIDEGGENVYRQLSENDLKTIESTRSPIGNKAKYIKMIKNRRCET